MTFGSTFGRVFSPTFQPKSQAAAAASGWWLAGGIAAADCVAAYQPKGAASYAASLVDLTGNGHDATEGTTPDWASGTGWTFDATNSEYLKTDVILNNYSTETSYLLKVFFTNDGFAIGSYHASSNRYGWAGRTDGLGGTWYNGQLYGLSGVIGFSSSYHVVGNAGDTAYLDKTAKGTTNNGDRNNDYPFYIGARNYTNSSIDSYFSGIIVALAVYSSVLTSEQVSAVTDAMNAI